MSGDRDRTPPLADRIGQWTTPRRTPADALANPDLHATIAELFTMVSIYREMVQELHHDQDRRTERLGRRTERTEQLVADLLAENERLRAELARRT